MLTGIEAEISRRGSISGPFPPGPAFGEEADMPDEGNAVGGQLGSILGECGLIKQVDDEANHDQRTAQGQGVSVSAGGFEGQYCHCGDGAW